MMNPEQAQVASSGVEALIEKLREEGVAAGQQKAESIVADAQARAEWMLQEAQREAQLLRDKTRAECEALRIAGEDALRLAARDAVLKLRDVLLDSFSKEVLRAVGKQMADEVFLQRLILALAGRVREEAQLDAAAEMVVELPAEAAGIDDLRKNPDELHEGALSRFTASLAGDLLRQGVRVAIGDDHRLGLLIKLQNGATVIDFSDAGVAALLLQHLQPRFRALLQGIIK